MFEYDQTSFMKILLFNSIQTAMVVMKCLNQTLNYPRCKKH